MASNQALNVGIISVVQGARDLVGGKRYILEECVACVWLGFGRDQVFYSRGGPYPLWLWSFGGLARVAVVAHGVGDGNGIGQLARVT